MNYMFSFRGLLQFSNVIFRMTKNDDKVKVSSNTL